MFLGWQSAPAVGMRAHRHGSVSVRRHVVIALCGLAPSRRVGALLRSCTVASCCCGLVPLRRTVAVLRRRVVTLSELSGGWHWRARLVHRVVVSASDVPAVALSRGWGCTAQRLCAGARRRGGSGNRRARGVVTYRRDRQRNLVV